MARIEFRARCFSTHPRLEVGDFLDLISFVNKLRAFLCAGATQEMRLIAQFHERGALRCVDIQSSCVFFRGRERIGCH